MKKGNNGEIRQQDGRLILQIDDWWLLDGAYFRAEYVPPAYEPDDYTRPMHVVLCNGDIPEVDDLMYLDVEYCVPHCIARGILMPYPRLAQG
jgi:hypothetical protein